METRVPGRFKVAFIAGTRPEIIKIAPVYLILSQQKDVKPILINTGQHREMSHMFLEIFNLTPDYDLNIMKPGQTLGSMTTRILHELEVILHKEKPDWVMVQGDTTSAFCGALSAFYRQTPVGHIEAGLRTWNKYSPFPEEMNRTLIGRIAELHFAPTQMARNNLQKEGIDQQKIIVTGNTVVDALHWIESQNHDFIDQDLARIFSSKTHQKIVTVTAHRRESWAGGITDISEAVGMLARSFPEVLYFFSVHPNPVVKDQVYAILSGIPNIFLHDPLDYRDFIKILSFSDLVITDSGGVQEEAPSLGVPVIITRAMTERPEIIEAGMGFLTGTDRDAIIRFASEILTKKTEKTAKTIFGDGKASQRITQSLLYTIGRTSEKPCEFTG